MASQWASGIALPAWAHQAPPPSFSVVGVADVGQPRPHVPLGARRSSPKAKGPNSVPPHQATKAVPTGYRKSCRSSACPRSGQRCPLLPQPPLHEGRARIGMQVHHIVEPCAWALPPLQPWSVDGPRASPTTPDCAAKQLGGMHLHLTLEHPWRARTTRPITSPMLENRMTRHGHVGRHDRKIPLKAGSRPLPGRLPPQAIW